jgi:hypothetical protein
MNFLKHQSKEYKDALKRGRMIRELGEVVLEEYGEQKCVEMLEEYKEKLRNPESE